MEAKTHPPAAVEQRPLGRTGLVASCQGLGAMGMTSFYGADPRDAEVEAESLRAFDAARECGVNFVDTAWAYTHESGATNEELARARRCVLRRSRVVALLMTLRCAVVAPRWRGVFFPLTLPRRAQVGKALAKHGRDAWVVATKFGLVPEPGGKAFGVDCRPETIRPQLADSLRRLGTDHVDLYYAHRIDPKVRIEDMMTCLKAVRDALCNLHLLHHESRCHVLCETRAAAHARSWWRRARCATWGCRSAPLRSCEARTRCIP